MWQGTSRTLYRRFRDGEVAVAGYAEDYACLVWGLLELFQAEGDPGWLEWALQLQRRQDELFWDDAAGGWYSTTGADPSVILRMKDDYDGAEPSATSVSVGNLIVLAHLTGDADWRARVERTLPGSRRPDRWGRPQRADDAGGALGVACWRPADRDCRCGGRRGSRRARAGSVGTLSAVRGGRASRARRAAAAACGDCAVCRRDEGDRRPGNGVCLPRLRVPGADVGSRRLGPSCRRESCASLQRVIVMTLPLFPVECQFREKRKVSPFRSGLSKART